MNHMANPVQFMREVKAEGQKVVWPGVKETRSLTIVVFIFVILISLFLTASDAVFSSAVRWLIGY